MTHNKPIELILVIVLVLTALHQEKGWRGIVPLQSTRTDVEKVVGSPKESRGVASTFQIKDGRVRVFYSDGFCSKGGINDWNVPPDTLVVLTFSPNKSVMLSDLKLDLSKYERFQDPHVERHTHYFNKDEGIRIGTSKIDAGEEVQDITYEPAAKDYHLRCPASSVQPTGANEREYLIRKFDEYSNILFSDEKARLDNFAIYLRKDEPQFKGYIIFYSGENTRSGEAQARAKRAKDYLVKVRGIKATRIITINGGSRDRLEVELYALPGSVPPPAPTPYRDE